MKIELRVINLEILNPTAGKQRKARVSILENAGSDFQKTLGERERAAPSRTLIGAGGVYVGPAADFS